MGAMKVKMENIKSHGKCNLVAKVLYFSARSEHFSETVSHFGDVLHWKEYYVFCSNTFGWELGPHHQGRLTSPRGEYNKF